MSAPERTVQGTRIRSDRDPAALITLPEPARYLGADRWVLYDIADCELHVFVETDERLVASTLYWVQFEQYVPSRPELEYRYDSPRRATIGGLDFYVDTWMRGRGDPAPAASDLEHVEAIVRAAGCTLPASMVIVRLVHLLDERKRKELMIIYLEAVTQGDWPVIEQGVIERAVAAVSIEPAG